MAPAVVSRAFNPTANAHAALVVAGQLAVPAGLGAAGISMATALLCGQTPPLSLVLASFMLVVPSYGIDRLADMREADELAQPKRAAFYRRWRTVLQGIYLALGLATLAIAASVGWWAVAYVVGFPLSVVLYALPLAPRSFRIRRFKDIPFAKNIYTALAWAALVPMACMWVGAPLSARVMLFAAFVFVQIGINVVVCDLKDEHGDREAGLRTFPTVLGRAGTLRLLWRVNLATVFVVTLLAVTGVLPPLVLALALVDASLIAAYLRYLARPDASVSLIGDVLADLVVGSWPLLIAILAF